MNRSREETLWQFASHSFTSYWRLAVLGYTIATGQEWHGQAWTRRNQVLNTCSLPCHSKLYVDHPIYPKKRPVQWNRKQQHRRNTSSMCWRWYFQPISLQRPTCSWLKPHFPPFSSFCLYTCQVHPQLRGFWLAALYAWDVLSPEIQQTPPLYYSGLQLRQPSSEGLSQLPSQTSPISAVFFIILPFIALWSCAQTLKLNCLDWNPALSIY